VGERSEATSPSRKLSVVSDDHFCLSGHDTLVFSEHWKSLGSRSRADRDIDDARTEVHSANSNSAYYYVQTSGSLASEGFSTQMNKVDVAAGSRERFRSHDSITITPPSAPA